MLADVLARPLRSIQAPALLLAQTGQVMLAEKAYDSSALRAPVAGMEAEAVIPFKRNRKVFIPHDITTY